MAEKELPRLTMKQKRFIKEYLKDLDASKACRRAGYDVNPKNANSLGSQLLSNTNLVPHLEKALAEMEYRIDMDTEDIIEETVNVATEANIMDFVDVQNGRTFLLKNPDELSPDQKKCIASLKETDHGIEVKLHDKMKALAMLGKWKGLEKKQVEVSGSIKLEDLLQESWNDDNTTEEPG